MFQENALKTISKMSLTTVVIVVVALTDGYWYRGPLTLMIEVHMFQRFNDKERHNNKASAAPHSYGADAAFPPSNSGQLQSSVITTYI